MPRDEKDIKRQENDDQIKRTPPDADDTNREGDKMRREKQEKERDKDKLDH